MGLIDVNCKALVAGTCNTQHVGMGRSVLVTVMYHVHSPNCAPDW